MAIVTTGQVIPTALWPQGDIRDPLGVWGVRQGVTGDASGGGIKVTFEVPAGLAAAYVYTCYGITMAILTQAILTSVTTKVRLLTNWPDIDPVAGVQGYSTLKLVAGGSNVNTTAPIGGFTVDPLGPNSRFILLFDPRPSAGELAIVEMEFAENVLADTYSFEGYGYFWDRSVLNAPGGPRHPGSS